MSYIPKELLLKSYETLSKLTDDHKQGQTQYTSAIRYLVAFDSFFYENSSDCDLDSFENREEFVGYVRDVVNIIDTYYTTNFYTTIKPMEDCGVGSNFFSAGVVNNSKQNTSYLYDYPTRGQSPLFKVKNNELIREVGYYRNVRNYLYNESLRCAFVVWLLRKRNISKLDAYSIKKDLLTFHTSELVDALMPKEENLNRYVEGYSLSFKETTLAVEDLMNLFTSNSQRSVDINSCQYRSYITAIKSKPFLLLAGISGTGKSRIVRELARACWDEGSEEFESQKPSNFEMVQVKPNWHDSSELIGYVSRANENPVFVTGDFLKFVAKAWEKPENPYFLCLDEMNLAPVEQYFAEYLSVIESRKADTKGTITTDPILKKSKEDWYRVLTSELTNDDDLRNRFLNDGICIPQNLIVIGTVNMDETTFSFSRKVLDRAMTIEMNEVDLYGGLDNKYEKIGKLGSAELIGTAVEGVDIYSSHKGVCDSAINYLQKINENLDGTPFKIAYRTRNEVLLYVVNNLPYKQSGEGEGSDEKYVIARALDEITNMKILSRIEGDESKVSAKFLDDLKTAIKEGLNTIYEGEWGEETLKSVSLAKLDEMKKRLSSGYTSFWS